jgi:nucleoside-diphosphate-sugar epimerase
MPTTLQGTRVAVTGATGFIGSRLARRLLAEGAVVTGAGRRLDRIEDLAHAGASLVSFDLADPTSYGPLVEGQQVLIHVAAWMGGPGGPDAAHTLNVDATRDLLSAAADAGVERVLLFSSVAVYGLPGTDDVDETAPLDTTQADPYGRTKALGETAARLAVGDRTELVIIRPAMVYGPGSSTWTMLMLKLVKGGTPTLLGPATGNAFPVYIDNLLDVLVAAATVPEAAGEAFHIADRSVSWADWLGYFGRMCDRAPRRVPMFIVKAIVLLGEVFPINVPLTRAYVELYERPIVFDTGKARHILGWEPKIDLDEGMRRSEEWLREIGRL